MFAPALCPAMVILDNDPPKLGTTDLRKPRAAMTSRTARLWSPFGDKNPNCNNHMKIVTRRKLEQTYCTKTILDNRDNGVGRSGKFRTVQTRPRGGTRLERTPVNPIEALEDVTVKCQDM